MRTRGLSRRSVEFFFVSRYQQNLGYFFVVSQTVPVSKDTRDKWEGASITIIRQNCSVSQYQNLSYRNRSVFHKIFDSLLGIREREVSRFCVDFVFFRSCEIFRRGSLLCFTVFGFRKS